MRRVREAVAGNAAGGHSYARRHPVLAAVLAELAPAYGPERPIILIVPLAPGGPIDIIARIVPTALHASLGQAIILDKQADQPRTCLRCARW